jgi:hypothetical protein
VRSPRRDSVRGLKEEHPTRNETSPNEVKKIKKLVLAEVLNDIESTDQVETILALVKEFPNVRFHHIQALTPGKRTRLRAHIDTTHVLVARSPKSQHEGSGTTA